MNKSFIYLALSGLILIFAFTHCENSNRADLDKILSPGFLPFLKESKLIEVSSYDTTGGNRDAIKIPAGKSATILDTDGPGVIVRIWLTVDSRDPYFLRRIVIRIYWDEEESPSVEVPLGDFFGCGFRYKQYSTPYLGMTSGGYVCFFPMPFEEKARIEILNETGKEVISLYYQVDYQKLEKALTRDIGYFHAYWNRDVRTNYDSNYVILNTKGRGHLVGVNMNMQSYDGNLAFLEGDEKVYIDGEKNPSIHGTGTEDYFSSGWYFNQGEYAGPYNGLILKDDSLGRIAAYRFHIPDPIPFKKSIRFTIEHGHANQEVADYSSTAYWYQVEPHKKFLPLPKAGLRIPLRNITPNKMTEAENLKFNFGTIPSKVMDMSDWGSEWSGLKQLEIFSQEKDVFTLTLSNLRESRYNFRLFYTKGPDYGNVTVYFKEQKVGQIMGFSPMIIPGGSINLKDIRNNGQPLTLKFVVIGKDDLSSGYKTGLDGISTEPQRTFIPDWYLAGPFPNPEKPDNKRFGLDSVYQPEEVIDLRTIYSGLKGIPVRWQYTVTPDDGYINLVNKFNPYELTVCYAVTYIFAPMQETIPLLLGSDDGSKVFLNNKEIYRYLGVRVAEPDQSEVSMHLKTGWNKLLFKIENNLGGFGFYARVIDPDSTLVINADQKIPVPANSKKRKK